MKGILVGIFVSFMSLNSCGTSNVFQPLASGKGKDSARSSFARGDYDKAISELENYLKNNPGDKEALSMLATARLKKIGVDQIQIAAKIASLQEEGGKSDWRSALTVMPAGTSANIEQLTKAIQALESIPADQRSPEQKYQLGMTQATLAVTTAKKIVGDDPSSPDQSKIDQMSDEDANVILQGLDGAKDNLGSSSSSNTGAKSLQSISSSIASEPGTTSKEKLQSYLKKN